MWRVSKLQFSAAVFALEQGCNHILKPLSGVGRGGTRMNKISLLKSSGKKLKCKFFLNFVNAFCEILYSRTSVINTLGMEVVHNLEQNVMVLSKAYN